MDEKRIGFRATGRQRQKLAELAQATGTTPSAVLRRLVESAELVEEKRRVPVATLRKNDNAGVKRLEPVNAGNVTV